jgi:hypothetical protein
VEKGKENRQKTFPKEKMWMANKDVNYGAELLAVRERHVKPTMRYRTQARTPIL